MRRFLQIQMNCPMSYRPSCRDLECAKRRNKSSGSHDRPGKGPSKVSGEMKNFSNFTKTISKNHSGL